MPHPDIRREQAPISCLDLSVGAEEEEQEAAEAETMEVAALLEKAVGGAAGACGGRSNSAGTSLWMPYKPP